MDAQQLVTAVPGCGPSRPVGMLRVEGTEAAAFLNGYTTQEVATLVPGEVRLGAITDWKGQVTDVVTFAGLTDAVLVTGSSGRAAEVHKGLRRYLLGVDVRLVPVSGWLALELDPGARPMPPVLEDTGAIADVLGLSGVPGVRAVLLGAVTPSAGPAARLLVPEGDLPAWGEAIRAAGWSSRDQETFDRQRIRAGWPEPDRDLPAGCNPWEARLAPFVRMDKGCYLGQEVVARLINYKRVQRWLMGTRSTAAVPEGTPLLSGEETVGRMGSSVPDAAGQWVGLALVGAALAVPGAVVRTVEGQELTLEERPLWAGITD